MENNLEKKNILIVGASSGIGNQLALQLTEKNRIFATFNKHSPTPEANNNLSFHYCDVIDDEQDLIYLPEELHGFVYCPGTINLKPFNRIQAEDFINDYRINVVGAIKLLQIVLPKLKASGNASILFFSTVAVQQGFNFHSLVSSSKGALEGLTRSLAAELAPSIRVNCIAPSITETPLSNILLNSDTKKETNASRHPLKRIGQPEDIANIASFLLSDDSSWITGQVLAVDGGMSAIKA